MAGVVIRWVGFIFLLATVLAWLANGYGPSPSLIAIGVSLVAVGRLSPPGDLPPGLTVEAPSRATRVPTIDVRKVQRREAGQ
jgi:hypothetical protein